MSVNPGRDARPNASPARANWFRAWRGALGVVVLLVLCEPVSAQADTPLTLAEAERLALEAEPRREALLAQAGALREQSVSAGQLLDPKVRFGLANFPLESGGFATEGMTQIQLGIRQDFPKGASRALRTRRLNAMADALAASASERFRDVRAAVRRIWLEAFYWQQAGSIAGETRPLLADLVNITRSLYAVGRRNQHDVLGAELELSRLDDRLLMMATQLAVSRGALAEWIETAAQRPLAPALPDWREAPPLAELEARLADHPALTAAAARVAAQEYEVSLAREQFKPGWMVDLGYGYREGSLPGGEPRSDFVSLMVTVDLPAFRRNRQSRDLAAALEQRRAAQLSQAALERNLASRLKSEYERWQTLTRRIELYEAEILVRADDRARAALAAYQSEAGDFSDVLRGYIDQFETRLSLIRLQIERAQSFAVLASLGGFSS